RGHIVISVLVLILLGNDIAEHALHSERSAETVTITQPTTPVAIRPEHPEERSFQEPPADMRPPVHATASMVNAAVPDERGVMPDSAAQSPASGLVLVALAGGLYLSCRRIAYAI